MDLLDGFFIYEGKKVSFFDKKTKKRELYAHCATEDIARIIVLSLNKTLELGNGYPHNDG